LEVPVYNTAMSLPVVKIDVDYKDEKGVLSCFLRVQVEIITLPEKIETFLSSFQGKDKDLARGFADIAINDDDEDRPTTSNDLKYMEQLVRVNSSCFTRLSDLQPFKSNE
jgi:DNA replication licensing factor MCM7